MKRAIFVNVIRKIIEINLYLFAFGIFISKALTSITGGLICIFWLIKIIFERKTLNIKFFAFSELFLLLAISISFIDDMTINFISNGGEYILLVLFFYAAANSIENLNTLRNIFYICVISAVISLVYGLYQHYFLGLSRVNAFMTPLDYGNLLAIILTFAIIYLLWGNFNYKKKAGILFLALISGMNLVFTQTRGAWLAFIAGIISLFWIKNKKLIYIVIVILIMLVLILPTVYKQRFISSFNLTDNKSNLGRIALWKGAILMFKDNLLNGVGFGNFRKQYEEYYRQPNTTSTVHAHNNILQFMAETGLIGLLALLYFKYQTLTKLYTSYKVCKSKFWSLFKFASFISLIIFYINGITEYNMGDADTLRFLWFLLSLNAALFKINIQE